MKRIDRDFRRRQRPLGWNAARAPRNMALGDIADVTPERERGGASIRRTDKNLSILRGKTRFIARSIKFLKLDLRGEIRTYAPCERLDSGKIHRRERRLKSEKHNTEENDSFITFFHGKYYIISLLKREDSLMGVRFVRNHSDKMVEN